jgi:hypothetical protein
MFHTERHEDKPLIWWYENRGHIDLEPDYQRRSVWGKKDGPFLIDSILNGYDIPKIYVADFRGANSGLNVAKKMYAIIDGKQRLEAVFGFFDGKFALADDFTYEPDPSLRLAGLTYAELRSRYPSAARDVEEYLPQVMSVVTDSETKIAGLFVRLNRGVFALSGAEIRNAMPGIVPILTRDVAKHPFFTSKIRFSIVRYQDRNAATKLLLTEFQNGYASVKKTDLNAFAESVAAEEGPATKPYREAAKRTLSVLDAMAEAFDDGDDLLTAAGIVPVYYWFIRSHPRAKGHTIRAFLGDFEAGRKANDDLAEKRARGVDQELLRYAKQRRSPNDQAALQFLHDVLERHWQEWRAD